MIPIGTTCCYDESDVIVHGPGGRNVVLTGDHPGWVRLSCDDTQHCASVHLTNERFYIERFAPADLMQRPNATRMEPT